MPATRGVAASGGLHGDLERAGMLRCAPPRLSKRACPAAPPCRFEPFSAALNKHMRALGLLS